MMYDWQGKEVNLSQVVDVEVSQCSIPKEVEKKWWQILYRPEPEYWLYLSVRAALRNGRNISHQWKTLDDWSGEQTKAYILRNELQKAVAQYEKECHA